MPCQNNYECVGPRRSVGEIREGPCRILSLTVTQRKDLKAKINEAFAYLEHIVAAAYTVEPVIALVAEDERGTIRQTSPRRKKGKSRGEKQLAH